MSSPKVFSKFSGIMGKMFHHDVVFVKLTNDKKPKSGYLIDEAEIFHSPKVYFLSRINNSKQTLKGKFDQFNQYLLHLYPSGNSIYFKCNYFLAKRYSTFLLINGKNSINKKTYEVIPISRTQLFNSKISYLLDNDKDFNNGKPEYNVNIITKKANKLIEKEKTNSRYILCKIFTFNELKLIVLDKDTKKYGLFLTLKLNNGNTIPIINNNGKFGNIIVNIDKQTKYIIIKIQRGKEKFYETIEYSPLRSYSPSPSTDRFDTSTPDAITTITPFSSVPPTPERGIHKVTPLRLPKLNRQIQQVYPIGSPSSESNDIQYPDKKRQLLQPNSEDSDSEDSYSDDSDDSDDSEDSEDSDDGVLLGVEQFQDTDKGITHLIFNSSDSSGHSLEDSSGHSLEDGLEEYQDDEAYENEEETDDQVRDDESQKSQSQKSKANDLETTLRNNYLINHYRTRSSP